MSTRSSESDDDDRKPRKNHLISRKKFREFMANHPGSQKDKTTFDRWCKTVEQAAWTKFSDVKATFGNADRADGRDVFNVGGNKYRVIADIVYERDKPTLVLVRHVLTHKEYDAGQWKNPP
jgi:mRNA interferase HigB